MPMRLPEQPLYRSRTDRRACRDLLVHGSRSFFAASLLLPQPTRDAAISLYAFCRLADDAIDDSDQPLLALRELEDRVAAIYAGEPYDLPADRALAVVARRHGIPRELIDALLEGFRWDCAGHSYRDLAALRDYAARVAGVVGVMMALLMGQRDPHVLARAADLGVAMQLTNIARDIGEDARRGRVYLPLEWLEQEGRSSESFLANPVADQTLQAQLERLLTEAEHLYRRSEAGIACLPRACRPCVMTARLLYSEIGEELRRRDYDAIGQRAVVSPGRKLITITRLARLANIDKDALRAPCLPETQYLVDAVVAAPPPAEDQGVVPGKLEWTLEMFAELDRRERRRPGPGASAGAPFNSRGAAPTTPYEAAAASVPCGGTAAV